MQPPVTRVPVALKSNLIIEECDKQLQIALNYSDTVKPYRLKCAQL